jgi:nitronate monooxygenase
MAAGMRLAATPMNPIPSAQDAADPLMSLLRAGGLKGLSLGGRTLLPIVQGGMGVGISAHRLAGSVAALGGVGTISSVDLRRHHPDLMERTRELPAGAAATQAAKVAIDAANLEALEREIRAARELSAGRGLLAINVMRAVSEYAPSVKRALECGIDAVVVGAGLPLDLPDLVRKWERRKRLPDAIVIEHPRMAGGHLGAAKIADLHDPRFDFENVIPQVLAFLRTAGIDKEIALIAAGGIRRYEDIARVQALGAAAAQLGTPFAVTHESDAHIEFKRVLAQAGDEDMVEFTSVAGLPARAVATPWLKNYLKAEPKLQSVVHVKPRCTLAFDCLAQCGLRDGLSGWGQFCIDTQLAAALRGDVKKGLFFRGKGALPFGEQIRGVRELMARLLTPPEATAACAAADRARPRAQSSAGLHPAGVAA